jgi:hypothetical protein
MWKGTTTDDYRNAMSAPDTWDMSTLAYQWQDKPQRLIYDLCGEIDYLRELLIKHNIPIESPKE